MTTIHHGLDSNLGGIASGSTDRAPSTQSQTAQTQAQVSQVSGQPVEVEITPAAQLLASLAQQISDTPDVNQSRVDSIRQALNNGSYQVNAGRVADGVLAAHKFDTQAAAGSQSSTAKAFAATALLGNDAG